MITIAITENFAANLATKVDVDDFIGKTGFDDKLTNLNKKVNSNI